MIKCYKYPKNVCKLTVGGDKKKSSKNQTVLIFVGFCVVFILCRNKKYPFYVGVHIELLMLMFTITTLVWLRAKATSTVTNRKVVSKSPACEKRHLLLNRFIYNIANVGQMALDDIPNLILVLSNRWR